MRGDFVGGMAIPILRVHVPLHHAVAQLFSVIHDVVVNGAVGRAQTHGVALAQRFAGVAHLGVEELLRDTRQVGMVVAVVAQAVATRVHLFHHFGVGGCLPAHHEEGRVRMVVGQHVEHLLRPRRIRAIVKGEEDGACGRAITGAAAGRCGCRSCAHGDCARGDIATWRVVNVHGRCNSRCCMPAQQHQQRNRPKRALHPCLEGNLRFQDKSPCRRKRVMTQGCSPAGKQRVRDRRGPTEDDALCAFRQRPFGTPGTCRRCGPALVGSSHLPMRQPIRRQRQWKAPDPRWGQGADCAKSASHPVWPKPCRQARWPRRPRRSG